MYQITIFYLSFLLFGTSLFLKAENRKWTSTSGTAMQAELIDFSNRIVILKSLAGKKITLSIDKLISSDQSFIKDWAAKKNILFSNNRSSNRKEGENKAVLSTGMTDLLPSKLLDANGKKVSNGMLAGKMVGFYFSAHWCPPCRGFTPSLVDFRDKNKEDFEVIFVSSDKSPDAQMDYMKEMKMKWYTLPHRSEEANKLSKKYGVSGIPALIIVSPEGEIISKNGRSEVGSNPKGAIKNWKKSG
jgi:nucleoredoxin